MRLKTNWRTPKDDLQDAIAQLDPDQRGQFEAELKWERNKDARPPQKDWRQSEEERFAAMPGPIPPSPPQPKSLEHPDLTALPAYYREEPESGMMIAAPPSRGSEGRGSGNSYGRNKVTLSRDELEVAAICGLSPAEFAAQKLELQRRKGLDPDRYRDK
jgi:hypothetical protein